MQSADTCSTPTVRAEFDKVIWEFKGKTFVYVNRPGCSGRRLTPSQASDLLVSLMGE